MTLRTSRASLSVSGGERVAGRTSVPRRRRTNGTVPPTRLHPAEPAKLGVRCGRGQMSTRNHRTAVNEADEGIACQRRSHVAGGHPACLRTLFSASVVASRKPPPFFRPPDEAVSAGRAKANESASPRVRSAAQQPASSEPTKLSVAQCPVRFENPPEPTRPLRRSVFAVPDRRL